MSFKTSFQWFTDFSTSTTGMQIIQFSAGGEIVRKRLAPMFAHYRKYKLGAIHVKFVPAATLPVDPTGLSYAEGEQTVDPRDMFNPGLVRNTNGEDVFIPSDTILNSDFSDNLYNTTMLDRRWKKFRMQRGITLRAFPKFWGVANLRQNMYPGYIDNVPQRNSVTGNVLSGLTSYVDPFISSTHAASGSITGSLNDGSSPMSLFQTGQKIPMGWMPTGASLKDEYGLLNGIPAGQITSGYRYVVTATRDGEVIGSLTATWESEEWANKYKAQGELEFPDYTWTVTAEPIIVSGPSVDAGATFAPVPEIPGLLTLVLPRSHKTQFYYRVYVKEDVYFADPVTSINAIETADGGTFTPLDVFTRDRVMPSNPAEPVKPFLFDDDTGQPLNDA